MNQLHEVLEVNWFDHVMVESGIPSGLSIRLASPSSAGDKLDSVASPASSNSLGQLIAVNPGQPNVHQDNLRNGLLECFEGSDCVMSHSNLIAFQFDQLAQRRCRVDVVLYDQNRIHKRGRIRLCSGGFQGRTVPFLLDLLSRLLG